ncbi:hypothetical protein [Luedemannella helvata]|uniref:hypothetical protein n=1 Tax=Luedemannella helvata TaxID=349315 RepID=UPI0031E28D6C
MTLREQLTDPWALAAAGLLGGLGAAVTAALASPAILALPVGFGIAGAVYGVNAVLGGVGRRRSAVAAPGLPAPAPGGAADGWLRRAEAALRTLHQQTESPADPVLRGQIADIDDQAAEAVADLRRLAGQVTLVEQAADRVAAGRLREEAAAIDAALARTPAGPVRDEQLRSRQAIIDQLEVARRLADSRSALLARMQAAVLGLEGLVARMSELLALHATTEGGSLTARRVAELAGELDGMRAGLAEAAEVSRKALADPDAGPR